MVRDKLYLLTNLSPVCSDQSILLLFQSEWESGEGSERPDTSETVCGRCLPGQISVTEDKAVVPVETVVIVLETGAGTVDTAGAEGAKAVDAGTKEVIGEFVSVDAGRSATHG